MFHIASACRRAFWQAQGEVLRSFVHQRPRLKYVAAFVCSGLMSALSGASLTSSAGWATHQQ